MPDTDPMTMEMTDVNPLTSVDNPRAHITVEASPNPNFSMRSTLSTIELPNPNASPF